MNKSAVWVGASVGGLIGGWLPSLWGDSFLSLWAILLSTIGGLAGIWVVYKLYNG
jgi:hypothetical protein